MDTEYSYREVIKSNLKLAQKRMSNIESKNNLLKSADGKFLVEYIDNRASSLVSKMTAAKPMSDREYLSTHGAIRELHLLRETLSAQEDPDKIQEEITTYEQQLKDI